MAFHAINMTSTNPAPRYTLAEFLDLDFEVREIDGVPRLWGHSWLTEGILERAQLDFTLEPPNATEIEGVHTSEHQLRDRSFKAGLHLSASLSPLRQFLAVYRYCIDDDQANRWFRSDAGLRTSYPAVFFHRKSDEYLAKALIELDRAKGPAVTSPIEAQFSRSLRPLQGLVGHGPPADKSARGLFSDWRGYERETARLLFLIRREAIELLGNDASGVVSADLRPADDVFEAVRSALTGTEWRVFELLRRSWPCLTPHDAIEDIAGGESRSRSTVSHMRPKLEPLGWKIDNSSEAKKRKRAIEGDVASGYRLWNPDELK